MKILPHWGSFMPALIQLVNATSGPILELGCGFHSTPYLHWHCSINGRRLVSYEGDAGYYKWFSRYAGDFHEIHFVTDWDAIDISGPWDVALVDHSPMERRRAEVARLKDRARYIIAHDTEKKYRRHYRYEEIYHLFKYHTHFKRSPPNTCVFSNIPLPEGVTNA